MQRIYYTSHIHTITYIHTIYVLYFIFCVVVYYFDTYSCILWYSNIKNMKYEQKLRERKKERNKMFKNYYKFIIIIKWVCMYVHPYMDPDETDISLLLLLQVEMCSYHHASHFFNDKHHVFICKRIFHKKKNETIQNKYIKNNEKMYTKLPYTVGQKWIQINKKICKKFNSVCTFRHFKRSFQ